MMNADQLTVVIDRMYFLVQSIKRSSKKGSRCRDWANEFDRLKASILSENLDWEAIAKHLGCRFDTNGGDLLA